MRKQLLFRRLFIIIAIIHCTVATKAAVIPYLPPLQSFGGTTIAAASISPSTGDFTIEVQGTSGSQINVCGSYFTYTPTTSGTIRFAQRNGKVYVYEGSTYMATIIPDITKIVYPDITSNITDSKNLLSNPGFETFPNNVWKCYDTTPTSIAITAVGTSGTSIRATTGLTGSYALLFHQTARYLTQSITADKIKTNRYYKLAFKYKTNATGQNGVVFRSQLGSSERSTDFTVTSSTTTQNDVTVRDYSTTFKVETINSSNPVWFCLERTSGYSASPQKLEYYDNFTLVEGTLTAGITGITGDPTYFAGTAYAPEGIIVNYIAGDYYDMTPQISNADFEDLNLSGVPCTPGWSNTNTSGNFQIQNNAPGTFTKNGNVYGEKYIASGSTLANGSISQTINNLPNGLYSLIAAAHAKNQSAGTYPANSGVAIFAGSSTTSVSTGQDYTLSNVSIANNSLQIGFSISSAATGVNWVGVDNFRLYYYGPIPALSVPQTTAAFTTATNTATIDLTGANLTSDVTITVPSSHITLSGTNVTGTSPNYTIAVANANQLNSITATWDKVANVSGNISFTSGTASKTVSVSSSDVESVAMSGITLSSGGLNTSFVAGTTSYTAKVPADLTSTTVSATTTPASIATVTNSGTSISASTTSVVLTGNSYNGVNHTSDYTVNWGGNYTISDWSGNGSSDATLSLPTVYGWSASPTITWVQANSTTAGTVRYMDMVSGANAGIGGITYTYNSANYDGRIMFVRWDGSASRVYSYPVYLESCKSYNLTSKAAYNSVASTGTITYKINTAKDNTGTNYATSTTTLSTAGVLVNANLSNISVPSTGVYYLTITSSQANLCAIADLNITENTTTSLSKSVSSLAFSTSADQKSFTLTGNALSGDISLTAPTGITLNITTVTAGDAQCGKVITATWNKLANATGNITINTAGLSELTIPVTTDDVETSSITSVTLSNGSINPTFSAGTTSYTVKAPADISSIAITGTSTSSAANIINNNGSVSNSNSLTLIGTSYNGLNTTNYTFTWDGNYSFTDWSANGDATSTNKSLPSAYGWKCINTTDHTTEAVWNNLGTQSNCRYRDLNSGYTYNGADWSTARALLIRWDGSSLTNRVFSYPLYLETGTTYQINGKAAWNSNGTAPTLTFSINSVNDNSGTSYATSAIATGNSGQLKDINLRNISVPSNGVYYFTINANTASLCAIEDLTINTQISENVSGDNSWSSATWSGGRTPLAGDDLTVSSGTLTIDQNASANTITVAPGAKVTVNNGVALNVGSILIQSDASGTATFVDADATGKTVTGTVQQYLPTGRNWYVGIPIANGDNSTTASSLTAGGATSVSYWDEPTGAWVNDYAGSLTKGRGYIAVSGSGSATNNISFTGTFNTGSVPVTVTRTVGATKEGFNLIANPYPSYLNPCDLITGSSKMEPTIWYRTKGAAYSFETVNTASGEGTNGVTGYIPPMQAFWVRVKANATDAAQNNSETLTFTNAMRYHANPSGVTTTALKAPKSTQNMLLRLQVSNGVNADEAIIYANTNASNAYDAYDSHKMSNNSALIPEIYTTVGSEQLVINGLNEIPLNTEIPVGFSNLQSGTNSFKLRASELRNISSDTKIFLLDKSTNAETELTTASDYTFTSEATNTTSRFSVIFKSAGQTTGTDNASDKKAIVYINNGQIVFVANEVPTGDNNSLMIFDATGRKVADRNITSTVTGINNINIPGVYLVRAIVNGQPYSAKINLNH